MDASKLRSVGVLFEDDWVLAVSKPAGIAVHGGAGEPGPTLIELITGVYGGAATPELLHRLDKPTSGVLLLAKTPEAAARIRAAWDGAEKEYLAWVVGAWDGPERIDTPLADDDGRVLAAETRVRVVASVDAWGAPTTVLSVHIDTGRTHQIRRHLAAAGHPVLLDDKHGDFEANKRFARAAKAAGARVPRRGLLLHARRIRVAHPFGSDPLDVRAPLGEDWRSLLGMASGSGALAAGLEGA